MATQFDGINRIITLTAGGAIHTVDAQVDLYSDWKEWVQLAENSKHPQAFDTSGGDPLTPGINAGSYYFLRNDLGWRIRPAEEDSNITMVGNLAARDGTLPILIPTIGNFTVGVFGLQAITQSVEQVLSSSQSATFNGQVAIDTVNGTSGTVYPRGTRTDPVNNLADAITIANREGITAFALKGTISLTQAFLNFTFVGLSAGPADVVQLNSQMVGDSVFNGVEISGAGTGQVEAIRCNINALSGVYGLFRSCGFLNNCTLGVGSTTFHQCFSEVAGNTKPWVSLNGGASNFGNRDWTGGFELRGVSNVAAKVSIDCPAGRIEIDSTCTNGEVVLGGTASKTDNSGVGCTVIDASLLSTDEQRRAFKATALRQYTNPATGNLDIHKDDDTLDQSVPIFEDDGVTAWDGVGQIRRRNKVS